jgi:uncharacterized protein
MSDFVLNVNDIDELGKDYAFPIDPSWVARVMEGCDVRADAGAPAGTLNVHAQKNGNDYLVTGTARAHFFADCFRCTEDAKVDVTAKIATLFTNAKIAEHDDEEDDGTDAEHFDGDRIVLDGLVREMLLLEVPMQPLCKPDCAGIPVPEHLRAPGDFGQDAREGSLQKALSKLTNKE